MYVYGRILEPCYAPFCPNNIDNNTIQQHVEYGCTTWHFVGCKSINTSCKSWNLNVSIWLHITQFVRYGVLGLWCNPTNVLVNFTHHQTYFVFSNSIGNTDACVDECSGLYTQWYLAFINVQNSHISTLPCCCWYDENRQLLYLE